MRWLGVLQQPGGRRRGHSRLSNSRDERYSRPRDTGNAYPHRSLEAPLPAITSLRQHSALSIICARRRQRSKPITRRVTP